MEPLLTYLAPPALGAFIGYMTNYVAIRMLFRPLKPWRFLGVRVPMTPGVIPSKRHDLAKNIGAMVGSHLLTSQDVAQALTGQGFRNELELVITDRVETILDKDLGPVEHIVPNRFRLSFLASVKVLRWRALEYIHSYLESDTFAAGLSTTIESHLDEILARSLEESLNPESRQHLYTAIEEGLGRLLAQPETTAWLHGFIDRKIEEILSQERSLKDLLPAEVSEALLQALEGETPALLKKAASLLDDPNVRERLATAIKGAIESFIASLGPMAALASSFLDPEAVDEKIRHYLESDSDKLTSWLLDDQVRQKIGRILRDKAETFLATPLINLAGVLSLEQLRNLRTTLAAKICDLFFTEKMAASLTGLLRQAIEEQSSRPLSELLSQLFAEDGVVKGKERITEEIITILRSAKVKHILDTVSSHLVESNLRERPIGRLADLLPRKVKEGVNDYLLQVTSDLLIREVPGLVDSLNIQRIVTRKVDSLDLLRLEGLLLSIMQEQFKYINLFGGLLGFLIGFCNLIFLL